MHARMNFTLLRDLHPRLRTRLNLMPDRMAQKRDVLLDEPSPRPQRLFLIGMQDHRFAAQVV